MKKLLLLLSLLFIVTVSMNAQTTNESSEQSLEDIFWESKILLLDTCTDSTIAHQKEYKQKQDQQKEDQQKEDQQKFAILTELFKKHDLDMKEIARCGCKILIKKYPEADYEALDSLGDLEGMLLMRECTSDDFLWDMYEESLSIFFGDRTSSCIIESLRNNVSLDKFTENMEYYVIMYAKECRQLIKDSRTPTPEPSETE